MHGLARRALLAGSCGLLLMQAHAAGLGEARLVSRWGQPLDARIAVVERAPELLDAECFSTPVVGAEGATPLSGVALALERSRGGLELRATTREPIRDLAVALTVRIACPGMAAGRLERTFVMLPDLPLRAPVESVALDDLRQPAAVPDPASAPAPANTSTAARASTAAGTLQPPAPAVRSRSERRLARAKAREIRQSSAAVPGSARSDGFMLRLSTEPPLPRTARGSASEALHERRAILDSDDNTAAFLAMQRKVNQLESQVSDLQLRLSVMSQATKAPASKPRPEAPVPSPWLPFLYAAIGGATVLLGGLVAGVLRRKAAPLQADEEPATTHSRDAREDVRTAAAPAPLPVPAAPDARAMRAALMRRSPASGADPLSFLRPTVESTH